MLEDLRSARDDHVQLMNSYRELHPLHPTAPHLRVRPAPLPEELRRLVTLRRPRATRNDGLHLGDRARAEREVLDVRRRGGHHLGVLERTGPLDSTSNDEKWARARRKPMSMGTRSARAGEVRPGAQAQRVLSSPGRVATVRGAYRTAEAGSTQYVR